MVFEMRCLVSILVFSFFYFCDCKQPSRSDVLQLSIVLHADNFAIVLFFVFLVGKTGILVDKILIQAGIAAPIGIPYFSFSERVKSTYCRTYRNKRVRVCLSRKHKKYNKPAIFKATSSVLPNWLSGRYIISADFWKFVA